MDKTIESIRRDLFRLRDESYRDFHCRLMPTVDKEKVIGIRTPHLRAYAKQLANTPESTQFLASLPHRYYEENNLHGFLIEKIKDFDEAAEYIDRFLPFVDNWATCDLMSPKVLAKKPDVLLIKIREWIAGGHTYAVRFAIKMLMDHFLGDRFDVLYCDMVASIESDEYYVNMMRAWYFATALAKQYESVISYLTDNRLDKWTHNKTIQKAVESYRIAIDKKAYLRTLRIK